MSDAPANGDGGVGGNGSRRRGLEDRMASRSRSDLVANLRKLAAGPATSAVGPVREEPRRELPPGAESCDLCGNEVPADHRHLLQLTERRIICACEPCYAMRSGDAELRPVGTRVEWLPHLQLTDDLWARLDVPIGLAFVMVGGETGDAVALYPSPAGATESEIEPTAWLEMRERNPELIGLEADAEALIVNRLADPPQYAIAPIDECYKLVGLIKLSWDGISGGDGPKVAATGFLEELRGRAETPTHLDAAE